MAWNLSPPFSQHNNKILLFKYICDKVLIIKIAINSNLVKISHKIDIMKREINIQLAQKGTKWCLPLQPLSLRVLFGKRLQYEPNWKDVIVKDIPELPKEAHSLSIWSTFVNIIFFRFYVFNRKYLNMWQLFIIFSKIFHTVEILHRRGQSAELNAFWSTSSI